MKTFFAAFIFLAAFGFSANASAATILRNVLVHFSSVNSKPAQDFLEQLRKEPTTPDEHNSNFIPRFSAETAPDGSITYCIEGVNPGNQYRIVEFSHNYTELDEGAWARMFTKPCPN
ncbi:MAG: hypothetical protein ACXWQO_15280 [Bdellovibrionota bacterium]